MAVGSLDDAVVWTVILLMGVGTYAFRVSFFVLLRRVSEVPEPVERALRFVPPAVLMALVVPAIVAPDDRVALTVTNPRLFAGLAAAVVAWRTEDLFATIVVGMGVLYLVTFVIG